MSNDFCAAPADEHQPSPPQVEHFVCQSPYPWTVWVWLIGFTPLLCFLWTAARLEPMRLLWTLAALYLSILSWVPWQQKREAVRAAVDADADGLWLAKRGKTDGLVRWGDVVSLRQRWGRLDALDARGERLIGISIHLTGMQRLAERLLLAVPASEAERAERRFAGLLPVEQAQTFRRQRATFRALLSNSQNLVFVFLAIGPAYSSYLRDDSPLLLIILAIAFSIAVCVQLLFGIIYRVEIQPDGVRLCGLLRRRFFRWADIRGVRIGGAPLSQTNYPDILLDIAPGTRGTNSEWLQLLPKQAVESSLNSVPISGFGPVPAALFQALHRGYQANAAERAVADKPAPPPSYSITG